MQVQRVCTPLSVTIDVLITVYNGSVHIRAAIESIQKQTFPGFRIIIVDDGSDDATPAILADMAAGDSRIEVHTKRNGGIVEAANFGLKLCTAEFIARHDADDLAYPERFERQIAYLRLHPNVLAISGVAHHIDLQGIRLGTMAKFGPPEDADAKHIPAREPYLLHPFLMVRREALTRVGGYRKLVVAEDTDLYWRLQELGALYNAPHFDGEYRLNPNSVSSHSVLSGRVMAVFSQLAALSAVRRRSQQRDIDFTEDYGRAITAQATSLEAACLAASSQLSPDEARHLRFAAAAKMLEMADFRPYELELSDCLFLKAAYDDLGSSLEPSNQARMLRLLAATAARLAVMGKWRQSRLLRVPKDQNRFWTRFLFRKLVPPRVHRRIRHSVGRVLALLRRT